MSNCESALNTPVPHHPTLAQARQEYDILTNRPLPDPFLLPPYVGSQPSLIPNRAASLA